MSNKPDINEWLIEAKNSENAAKCGMYLTHNGVVRVDAKSKVREGNAQAKDVIGMDFDYDEEGVQKAIDEAYKMPGIYYIKTWLNRGRLLPGDDIMFVLIGGDIRPHVVDALQSLVGTIKNECVVENEKY